MPLTDSEAQDAFTFLVATLRDVGLGWVVTQVEEKLALGKVQAKKLRARNTPEYFEGFWEIEASRAIDRQKASSAFFAVAEEYTPQERLDVLLDSIVIAVPVVREVAEATFQNLRQLGAGGGLAFVPEAEVSEPYFLEAEVVFERQQATDRLMTLIHELRDGGTVAAQTESSR